jgi:alkylation response protein AidB-like acyl-CoA dehydrogenase
MTGEKTRKGGSFLVEDAPTGEVFTPEDLREEHRMIVDTAEDFVKNEVQPHIEVLEHKNIELTCQLMRQAGELGLLGADVEEEYGGAALDSIAALLIVEHMGGAASFGVTLNCHTGIGSMPLIYFGNRSQKEKYLPSLVTGEKIGAYALTEPKAGTDALSIETKAVLSADGKYYTLNGTKQFVTNGGYADIIFTYAKVDGDKFTAFLLEKDFEGVSTGPEEKKMGIRGTSTVSLLLEDAKVPVGNVLFEVGRGHVVAFSILDIARLKLGLGCVGFAKVTLESSVKHAKERVQFGKPICQFGLIKHKIAEMAIRTYIAESMTYRTGGLLEDVLATVDGAAEDARLQSIRRASQYTIEYSINKVHCSEMISYVADEAVQICGGYGYIEESVVERIYRDCRIYRIYEGTNEINRTIIVRRLMEKGLKNELPLFLTAEDLTDRLTTVEYATSTSQGGPLVYERQLVHRAKKVFAYAFGSAARKYAESLSEEQEIVGCLADIVIEIYAMESGLLRALKSIESSGEERSETKIQMVRVYVSDAMARTVQYARQILAAMEAGDHLHTQLEALAKLSSFVPLNTVETRRRIADSIIDAERFMC